MQQQQELKTLKTQVKKYGQGYDIIQDHSKGGYNIIVGDVSLRFEIIPIIRNVRTTTQQQQKCSKKPHVAFVIYLHELRGKDFILRKSLLLTLLAISTEIQITDIYVFYNDKKFIKILESLGFTKNETNMGICFSRSLTNQSTDREQLKTAIYTLLSRYPYGQLQINQMIQKNATKTTQVCDKQVYNLVPLQSHQKGAIDKVFGGLTRFFR